MSPTKKRKVSLPTEDNVEEPSVIGSGPKEATYFAQSREQRPEAEESVTSEKAEVGGKAFNINMERQERFKALQARAVSNPRITQACVAMSILPYIQNLLTSRSENLCAKELERSCR